jgi:hypothetical protein
MEVLRLYSVRTMDTTYLHIGMILSTLGLSPHGFALGLYPKGLIPMEIFVHPYIPMILPISSQCGTLIVYPTILPSNKGPPSLPSNRLFIRPLSTNHDSSFSTSLCWGQDTFMKHPESTTWLESFLLFLGQLLFTVLGSGHVHEASGAHRLFNRADLWITSWLGAHHFLFGILRIHPSWLTLGSGSDTTCKNYGHHLSPHWYDIVHFGPKPSWICSWVIPKRPHTNGDICSSLYTYDPSHF